MSFSISTAAITAVSSRSSTPNPTVPVLRLRKSIVPSMPYSFSFISRYRDRDNGGSSRVKQTRISPVMEWQDCTVKMEIDVPTSVAYNCYSDREAISKWMPFISSVKVLEDKPELSRWSLKYKAFGQDIEFSWLARNMQPIPNQKIHWRSLEGLPNRWSIVKDNRILDQSKLSFTKSLSIPNYLRFHNAVLVGCRGTVRFYPKGPSSCMVELTVSYEVPQLLVPVASALRPFLESLLVRGLERFAKLAKSYSTDSAV